jgi:hypothetical protein
MAYTYRVDFFIRILRLALGAFFIILGICGIFPEFHESIFELHGSYYSLEIIFGIVEIFCGFLLVLGFFVFRDASPVYWGAFIAFIAWVARIVISMFVFGFSPYMSVASLFQWLLTLSVQCIIGAGLLVILRRHE